MHFVIFLHEFYLEFANSGIFVSKLTIIIQKNYNDLIKIKYNTKPFSKDRYPVSLKNGLKEIEYIEII